MYSSFYNIVWFWGFYTACGEVGWRRFGTLSRFHFHVKWKIVNFQPIAWIVNETVILRCLYGSMVHINVSGTFLFRGGIPKIVVNIPTKPCLCVYTYIHAEALLPHWDYSNISNYQTKILAIFRGIFIIFLQYFKIVLYYSTISLRTPNNVPRNSVWETLIHISDLFEWLITKIRAGDVVGRRMEWQKGGGAGTHNFESELHLSYKPNS